MSAERIPAGTLRVEVVYALPQQAWSVVLELPAGAIASEAIARSGYAALVPGFDATTLACAVFGKPVSAATVLRDGDRLELLRPLVADPKQARRVRARQGD